MNIDEIKELISVVNESGIAELEVQRGENRVRIKRSNGQTAQDIVLSPNVSSGVAHGTTAQVTASSNPGAAIAAAPEDTLVYVKSPIVGTYYDAPSPGSPSFVKVGDRVSTGQTLCIIESMKLMNEIESEVSGTVVNKLVENGRPVEYGEALFAVQPA